MSLVCLAAELLADRPVDRLPHVAAWRAAYRAFGAKPQRTRNSLEALTRRAAADLMRARGTEPFDTVADGADVVERPPVRPYADTHLEQVAAPGWLISLGQHA